MGSNTDARFTPPFSPRRRIIASALLALLLAGTSRAEQPPKVVKTTWHGFIQKAQKLEIVPQRYDLTLSIIEGSGGRLTGSMYAPVWGETDWPCEGKLEPGGLITFGFTDGQRREGVFELQVGEAGQTLFGQYSWKPSAFEEKAYRVRLSRLDTPATRPARLPAQAQIPLPPFPYAQEHVVFGNGELKISGLLTLPSATARHPAIVLIPGSEPQDSDPQIPGLPEAFPWIQVIADHLTRAGFATLRTDSRGVGGTAGDFDQATLQDLAADVQAAVTYLRSRKDIDPDRVGLVGHSQGASVAAIAAARDRDVRFLVMLGGAGVRGDRFILAQIGARWKLLSKGDARANPNLQMMARVFELSASGASKDEVRERITAEFGGRPELKKLATPAAVARWSEMYTCPRWRSVLRHDPRDALTHCRVPVLAMSGEKDFLLDPGENLPAIRDALRAGGNPDVTVTTLPGLDHSFEKSDPTAAACPPGQVIDPAALAELEKWLDRHVTHPKQP